MNRDLKIEAGLIYHIYNRGNNKNIIFKDRSDYIFFIDKLKTYLEKYLVNILIYTLMPNHYHLLAIQNKGGSISNMIGALATSTAKRFNLKYGHIGHLFQGPFRYVIVPDEMLYYVGCYIHLNPVRAGLSREPEGWEFSNFRDYTILRAKQKENFNTANDMKNSYDENKPLIIAYEYIDFVKEILRDERAEKEYWQKVHMHAEGFLFPRRNQDKVKLQQ